MSQILFPARQHLLTLACSIATFFFHLIFLPTLQVLWAPRLPLKPYHHAVCRSSGNGKGEKVPCLFNRLFTPYFPLPTIVTPSTLMTRDIYD